MDSSVGTDVTWLYLVRHGATEANERVPYILQGNGIDLPLSAAGERQAAAVADFLPQFPIRHVYSSGMLRARQTAAKIAMRLDLQPAIAQELHECDVGRWEGLDWGTIRERYPDEHRMFIENPAETPYFGGESYGDVLRRAKPAVERLLAAHIGESIAVVAHNVVNRALLSDLLGLDLKRAPKISQANCCVNLIRARAGKIELVSLNGVFHLGPFYLTGGPAG
ncbi:MAG TPA: histidine phosphatase family protein [Planctomycetaceae bacterium]|jgi:broad specificity phosphatase PhoE